jgi:8-oxo-dGTP diphosphatase
MQDNVRVVVAEVCDGERYLITQRSESSLFGGLWEFPGGRVRTGETDQQALSRALLDRLGVSVEVGECLEESGHSYAPHHITLAVYRCTLGEAPRAVRVAAVAWVAVEELDNYSFPPADEASIVRLLGEDDEG